MQARPPPRKPNMVSAVLQSASSKEVCETLVLGERLRFRGRLYGGEPAAEQKGASNIKVSV